MTVETPERSTTPQIDAEHFQPAGENSLICQNCGHILVRVVVCGTQERCTAGKYDKHYHCLVGCKSSCASLGECVPRDGKKMNTAIDTDDFEFDPEEFARVMREVGIEYTKLQEQIIQNVMEFGNAWNRIVTPEFREAVEKAVEKKDHEAKKKIMGIGSTQVIYDEVPLFEVPKADEPPHVSEIGEMHDALRLLANWYLDLSRTDQNFLDTRQNELLRDWDDRWNLISFDHETPMDDEQAVRWALDKIRIRIDEAAKK